MSNQDNWTTLNRDQLSAYIESVRAQLELTLVKKDKQENIQNRAAEFRHKAERIAARMEKPSRIDFLCSTLGLTSFEKKILILCAGVELVSSFAGWLSEILMNERYPYPTFSMALSCFQDAHFSALSPEAPLRKWRLIEFVNYNSVTCSNIKIDESILRYLAGLSYVDERLLNYIDMVELKNDIPASHSTLVEKVLTLWNQPGENMKPDIIHLCGIDYSGKADIAWTIASRFRLPLYKLYGQDIPAGPGDRTTLVRLLMRKQYLSPMVLMIDLEGIDENQGGKIIDPFLDSVKGYIIISSDGNIRVNRKPSVFLEVSKPLPREQKEIWFSSLNEDAVDMDIDSIVMQFDMNTESIKKASHEFRLMRNREEKGGKEKLLWKVCKGRVRTRMRNLAQRIDPAAKWDELILPPMQKQILKTIIIRIKHRFKVYYDWGFGRKVRRGLGTSALFCGPSGTGKTMAAEVIAGEMDLDLYKIDLSSVVSKYIGETEKNLQSIFNAAEEGGAILLFDEADALFGKRSEVKDSHDRYANIEISYLLQRMENYRGLAILTTNMKEAIDQAFFRRIKFVVNFPFPDANLRRQIWNTVFPSEMKAGNLDFDRLSRLNITGGNIQNIALSAIFLAAEGNEMVNMNHLLEAARLEYYKIDKQFAESEIKGWNTGTG